MKLYFWELWEVTSPLYYVKDGERDVRDSQTKSIIKLKYIYMKEPKKERTWKWNLIHLNIYPLVKCFPQVRKSKTISSNSAFPSFPILAVRVNMSKILKIKKNEELKILKKIKNRKGEGLTVQNFENKKMKN